MSPWLFNVYNDGVMNEVKMGMRRRGESEDYLASCKQMTWLCMVKDLRAMVRQFVEVYKRSGLKVVAGKSKVKVMNVEEGFECEVHLDGVR